MMKYCLEALQSHLNSFTGSWTLRMMLLMHASVAPNVWKAHERANRDFTSASSRLKRCRSSFRPWQQLKFSWDQGHKSGVVIRHGLSEMGSKLFAQERLFVQNQHNLDSQSTTEQTSATKTTRHFWILNRGKLSNAMSFFRTKTTSFHLLSSTRARKISIHSFMSFSYICATEACISIIILKESWSSGGSSLDDNHFVLRWSIINSHYRSWPSSYDALSRWSNALLQLIITFGDKSCEVFLKSWWTI